MSDVFPELGLWNLGAVFYAAGYGRAGSLDGGYDRYGALGRLFSAVLRSVSYAE